MRIVVKKPLSGCTHEMETNMINRLKNTLLVLATLLVCTTAVHAEVDLGITNVLTILPGATRVVEIKQTDLFPFGCPNYLILVLGQGTLGLSVLKDDVSGDIIFMTGAAVSAGETIPFFRIGRSMGMVSQILEIGSSDEPYGLVWVYCGIALSPNTPLYLCDFRVSLSES